MAKELSINVKVGADFGLNSVIDEQVFPLLSQAVNAVGFKLEATWKEEVYKAKKMWSGEKDLYANSIAWTQTKPFGGVVEANYKWAEEIENGRPSRDLKKMLNTSLKVRRTKAGTRFLIIPFRHNIKAMPAQLYSQAKALEASKVTGSKLRRSGEIVGKSMQPLPKVQQRKSPFLSNPNTKGAMMVKKSMYSWGGRLAAGYFGPNPKGKTDIAAGMVRFDTSSGAQKSSQYLTFRVMSEKAHGKWIVPPQPGQPIARSALEKVSPLAEAAFKAAIAYQVKNGK